MQVEDALRDRVDKFETKVNKATKELDLFMRKDPPVLTMDEMRSSSSLIDKYVFKLVFPKTNKIIYNF